MYGHGGTLKKYPSYVETKTDSTRKCTTSAFLRKESIDEKKYTDCYLSSRLRDLAHRRWDESFLSKEILRGVSQAPASISPIRPNKHFWWFIAGK